MKEFPQKRVYVGIAFNLTPSAEVSNQTSDQPTPHATGHRMVSLSRVQKT